MQGTRNTTRHGFTLVELAIVLVIIGLVVGGALTGQQLIAAAELRKVASDLTEYQSALDQFYGKYVELPGDMTSAVSYWGEADASNCTTTIGTGTATCNGNGNGQVTGTSEPYRAWQHLVNANLIKGYYIGTLATHAGYAYTLARGVNVPALPLADSLIFLFYSAEQLPAALHHYPKAAGNDFFIYNRYADTVRPTFTPAEAKNIDDKIDDGRPGKGRLRSYKQSSSIAPNCADSDDPEAAVYRTTDPSVLCAMAMRTMY